MPASNANDDAVAAIREVLPFFLEQKTQEATCLLSLIEKGRFSETFPILHRIRGSGGTFGLHEVSSRAEEIHAACLDGRMLLASAGTRGLMLLLADHKRACVALTEIESASKSVVPLVHDVGHPPAAMKPMSTGVWDHELHGRRLELRARPDVHRAKPNTVQFGG